MTDTAAPAVLRPSARCIALIKSFETCARPVTGHPGYFAAYKPTIKDRWTIGWGTTGRDIIQGLVWSQAQCDACFERDVTDFAAGVNHLLAGAQTTQGQFDGLLSFAYNVGLDDDADVKAEGLGDSTLLRLHRAGDYAGAAAEFPKWDKQDGIALQGLLRRRRAEAALYTGQA